MKNSDMFEKHVQVGFRDCDYKEKMKISTILEHIADIAGEDYTAQGYGHAYLWDHDMVFLLSRVSVRLHRTFKAYEQIKVRTYEIGVQGPLFYRGVELISAQGAVAVSANSAWILCNPITRKIRRPSIFEKEIPNCVDRPLDCAQPIKLKAPKKMEFQNTRKIRFSDLDCNGHVYNAVYADIACDHLPIELFESKLTDFSINFVNEARYGDTIELYTAIDDKQAFVKGIGQKGICFECVFYFE